MCNATADPNKKQQHIRAPKKGESITFTLSERPMRSCPEAVKWRSKTVLPVKVTSPPAQTAQVKNKGACAKVPECTTSKESESPPQGPAPESAKLNSQ